MPTIPHIDPHELFFGALMLGTFGLCLFGVWSRRGKWYRWSCIALGTLVLAGAYPTMVSLLSLPRSVDLEYYYRSAKQARVLGVAIDEGKALYVLLHLPGVKVPRYYSFPWNDDIKKFAESLQEALEKDEARNGVFVDEPFQPSLERKKPLKAYPKPQTAPPLKPSQPRPPREFAI